VTMFQKLIVRRWDEYLGQSAPGEISEAKGVA